MEQEGESSPSAAVATSSAQAEHSSRGKSRGKRRSDEKKQSCKSQSSVYVEQLMNDSATTTDLRKKRPPKRLSQRPNDIYVNRKSDFASQLARCHKLLDQGWVGIENSPPPS